MSRHDTMITPPPEERMPGDPEIYRVGSSRSIDDLVEEIIVLRRLNEDIAEDELAQLEHAAMLLSRRSQRNMELQLLRLPRSQRRHRAHTTPQPTVRRVRVSAILQKGSIIVAIICILSLVSLFWTNSPIMNPFLSLLMLIAAPFFYGMGALMLAEEHRNARRSKHVMSLWETENGVHRTT